MAISPPEVTTTASDNTPVYRASFATRSHQILEMGYDRLHAPSYSKSEEDDITGELIRAMHEALEDHTAPPWAKYFWAVEEVRVHETARHGKRRRRIDIEIIQVQAGPRPRFRYEAKRLHDSSSRLNPIVA